MDPIGNNESIIIPKMYLLVCCLDVSDNFTRFFGVQRRRIQLKTFVSAALVKPAYILIYKIFQKWLCSSFAAEYL